MRVLMVSDVYFPRVNGVSTSIASFRAGLAEAGVATTLVCPWYQTAPGIVPGAGNGSGAGAGTGAESGVLRVPAGKVPFDPEDRRMHWRALQQCMATLQGQDFDLVHVHTPFLAHYAGLRFARGAGLPVVTTFHTLFEEYLHLYVPLLPRSLGRGMARALTRAQCNAADGVIAPSQPMAELLAAIGVRERPRVIPTGLPADRFVPGDGARFRRRHGLPERRPLLLYVGRVAREKNLDFLLLSFLEVRRARPDAMLVIAGEGPARAALAAQVERLGLGGDVAFVGYLDRERGLADCYAAAAVFVFASRTETQGLVLLEAMAQGCAVVSTAQLGTTSILQPGCGARIAPEQPGAFAQAVIGLLDDPQRAARCGAAARRYARGWDQSRMAGRLQEFYAELCARAKIARGLPPAAPGESHERQACLDSR
jgi:1,2-diacylglycerol 3-alpha-glucosyltransferase